MNTQHDTQNVTVQLTGSAKDAAVVLDALRASFRAADDGAKEPPREDDSVRPMVWTAVFDTSQVRGKGEAASLGEAVTAELSGGYQAVDRLAEVLGAVFEASEDSSASGDQEKELHLRLESLKS